MMNHTRQTSALASVVGRIACVAALLLSAAAALADSVKIKGFWIPDVTVLNVTEGQMIYSTAAGDEVTKNLSEIEALKLTAYPDLATAEDAFEAGKHADAATAYQKVHGLARQPWLKHYVQSRRVVSLDKLNRPVDATEAYLSLVREKADAHYLGRPPIASLAGASAEQKQDLLKRIAAASSGAPEAAAESLKKMTDAIGVTAAALPAPAPGAPAAAPGATPATPAPAPATPVVAEASDSLIVLPKVLADNDKITLLLRKGQFEEALATANEILAKPNNEMSKRLYQRGLAQLGIAEQLGKEEAYLDAGLSFMRVIVHFPGVYTGPSLVEVGYIHRKINREDVAAKMWDQAKEKVDEEEDPELRARLEQLMAGDAAPFLRAQAASK
jgi:hypothetical protein